MGLFDSVFLSPKPRSKLPLYEQIGSPNSNKESNIDDDYSSDEDDDTEYSVASPSSVRDSRQTSSSSSASALMIPKRPSFGTGSRRPGRPYFYRLPNKVIRYLCIGMITTILLFILSLVRASQIENWKVANGEVEKQKAPPPAYESFEFLTRYYGGLRSLASLEANPPQYPLDEDEQPLDITEGQVPPKKHLHPDDHKLNDGPLPASKEFLRHPGSVVPGTKSGITPCFLGAKNSVKVPPIRYFDGRPNGFPQNVLGSYELLSLSEDICFERFGRYGPYGFGYSSRSGGLGVGEHGEKEGSEAVWSTAHQVDYRQVDWAETQRQCYQANSERFKPLSSRFVPSRGFYIHEELENASLHAREATPPAAAEAEREKPATKKPAKQPAKAAKAKGDLPRTAVVIRCWDEYGWGEEDIMNLRAVITELSLASGGRYDVHLLVQVKNDARYPIWADDETYQQRIRDAIPEEFQKLVTLWTETQMLSVYQGIHDLFTRGPNLPVHGVYRGLQMAMQFFAYNHPEYDYFWQWEMDIRYTGHYYDLFAKMENWARDQPRKGLWERNARFYAPSVHGSWEDFRQMARVQTELGKAGADNIWNNVPGKKKDPHEIKKGEQSVWGPVRPVDSNDWFEPEKDPKPPTTYEKDRYVWGRGEEADYIALNPMFDPQGTTWLLADDITGYNESEGIGKPPRRTQIITASRMSRRLLLTMHRETAFKKHHAFPEMWPATVSLQHGYKAVYVPHPVYVDREWPVPFMVQTLNNGRNGATGGARTSVFGEREHNLRGVTWYYNSGFAPNLYRRWLGLKVNNDGGEEFELQVDMSKDDSTVSGMRGGEGRMCLPPMLLHPVKDVDLPVEINPEELQVAEPESDPAS